MSGLYAIILVVQAILHACQMEVSGIMLGCDGKAVLKQALDTKKASIKSCNKALTSSLAFKAMSKIPRLPYSLFTYGTIKMICLTKHSILTGLYLMYK